MSSHLLDRADRSGQLDCATRMAWHAALRLGLRFEDATRASIEARVAELCRQLDPTGAADRERIIEIEEARRWALDLRWRYRLWREGQRTAADGRR